MRYPIVSLAILAVASLGLGACAPSIDPHNLAYSIFPGDSPDVMHYTTTSYPSLTAPPVWPSPGGKD
jgi:hypothetical protein